MTAEHTPMTKERLMRYRSLRMENENQLERLARMKSGEQFPAMREGEGAQHTGAAGDRLTDAVIRRMEYEERIRPLIEANLREMEKIEEAARIDGAGPWRFFVDVVLPLSRTNTAALFVVLFIYGWNQYLWPLLVTNQESMYTIVMGIQRMVNIPDAVPEWNLIMAVALLGMLPPLLVVLGMQKLFVRGLVETEK